MFKLPSKSKYSGKDHEKLFYDLLEEKRQEKKPTDAESERLNKELEYVKKYNLYSLFLLLHEITVNDG